MEYAFVVNPIAGSGRSLNVMKRLEGFLHQHKIPYRIHETQHSGHGTELAQRLSQNPEVEAVISVGGDGTAFEVASGLCGTDKPMGIIPAGTGNDFIKSVGIPKDPLKALQFLLSHHARPVDMGKRNDQRFLNVCGTGFDVMVLDQAEKFKKHMKGLLPYLLGLIRAIVHYKPVHVRLEGDGVEEEGDFLICTVANGSFIGGGIPMCPSADTADGKLDLVLVDDVPRWKIPLYLPALLKGKVLNFPFTRHMLVHKISLLGEKLRVNVDGEIFSMDRVSFSILPSILQLIW